MNEQEKLDLVDARINSAADSLRRAVADLPVPPLASGVRQRRFPRFLLAAVAVLLLVVGVIAALAVVRRAPAGRSSVVRPNVTRPPGARPAAVKPYLVGGLGSGYGLARAARTDSGDPVLGVPYAFTVYGPPSAEAALMVLFRPGVGSRRPFPAGLTVGGHPARYFELPGAANTVDIQFPDGVVELKSTLARAALLAVAESVRLNGTDVSVSERSLPAGWKQVDQEKIRSWLWVVGLLFPGPGATAVLQLHDSQPEGLDLVTASAPGAAKTLSALRRAMTDPVDTTVRGHAAVAGVVDVLSYGYTFPIDTEQVQVVAWQERPGNIVAVSGSIFGEHYRSGVSMSQSRKALLRAAQHVRVVNRTQFNGLLARTARTPTSPDFVIRGIPTMIPPGPPATKPS